MQQTVNFDAMWDQVKPVVTAVLCKDKGSIDTQRWMTAYKFALPPSLSNYLFC